MRGQVYALLDGSNRNVHPGHQDTRYDVLSAPLTASRFPMAIRGHWVLDMVFAEDPSRARVGHGAESLTLLCRLALTIFRFDHSTKIGVKARRMKAA
jgi:hypothetical protein